MPDLACRIISDMNIPQTEAFKETVDTYSDSSDSNSEVESENHSELDIEDEKNVECVEEEIQTERISVTDRQIQCDIIRVMPMNN